MRHFPGTGVVGRPGEVWVIESGIPAPPALVQNSEPYDGPVPYDAVRYDQAAHDVYLKLNTPRAEPPPPVLLTADGVCQRLGLSEAQFRSARETGFPKPTGHRDLFDGDGIPTGQIPLWHLEVISGWMERVKALGVGR